MKDCLKSVKFPGIVKRLLQKMNFFLNLTFFLQNFEKLHVLQHLKISHPIKLKNFALHKFKNSTFYNLMKILYIT